VGEELAQKKLDAFSDPLYKLYKLLSVPSLCGKPASVDVFINDHGNHRMEGMGVPQKVLLVQPEFPFANKSRWHKSLLPVGLLKLASYYRKKGYSVKLVYGRENLSFRPDRIMIGSLFTYWSKYVWDCVKHYKQLYPNAKIVVGGIYASLMPEHCKQSGCDEVFIGVHKKAEKCEPAYDLVNVNYQIIHTSRGCVRRCKFCGVWKIEPKFEFTKSIKNEIRSNQLVFYDNNLLANPYIENILEEIANTKFKGRAVICESQCGFDGRLLTPKLAKLIKKAHFQYPKIAWDGSYSEHKNIKKQLDMLIDAGYSHKDISVFMIYNWDQDFREMEKKRLKCWEWKVQISDCRYRPLDQTYDNYNPKRAQTNRDYFVHPKWTDAEIKQFRKNVRRQNICVRMGADIYDKSLEQKNKKRLGEEIWSPSEVTCSNKNEYRSIDFCRPPCFRQH
jgi:hypothetical protein